MFFYTVGILPQDMSTRYPDPGKYKKYKKYKIYKDIQTLKIRNIYNLFKNKQQNDKQMSKSVFCIFSRTSGPEDAQNDP